MITHLSIKNFKLFEDQFFTFSNLNLLTGINGFGKSSLIQLLLLLRESKLDRGLLTEGITLSGNKLFNMRQASDALRVGAKEPFQIEIDLGIDNQSNILVLDASKDKSNQLTIIDNKTKINKKTFDDCELFKENTFVYLNANRIDPAHNSYGNAGEGVKNKFGNDGRASISFYQNNLGFVVDEKLCKQGTSDLPTQVKY